MSALEDRIARGEEAFARGDLATARALLSACAEDSGATPAQCAHALNDLAVIAAAQSLAQDAEQLLLRALAHDAGYVPALENLGDWCAARDDRVQATHWLRRVIELEPERADVEERLQAVLRTRRLDRDAPESSRPAASPGAAAVERVLIVVDRFFPSVGGTERLAEAVGVSLQSQGMTVEVAVRAIPDRDHRECRGMAIHDLHGDLHAALAALVQSGGYDAVLAFSNATVWPVVASLQLPRPRPRIAVVPCVNAKDSAQLRANDDMLRAYGALVSAADALGYSSRSGYDVRLWEDLGLAGVYVPNAIDRTAAAACAPTAAIDRHVPRLLVVANFWSEKNHVGLLHALRDHPGDWRLALIGDASPEEPQLAREVARLAALDPRVHLLGPAAPESVAAAMDDATILLLPSLAEATPLVLLEAMSRELPWIATPTCGAAHDHAGGMILPLDLFGEGIDFLLASAAARRTLGAAGQAHWRACYTWNVVGPRYGQLLRGEPVADLSAPAQALRETEAVRSDFYEGRPAVAAVSLAAAA